jgi:hypothetical protein
LARVESDIQGSSARRASTASRTAATRDTAAPFALAGKQGWRHFSQRYFAVTKHGSVDDSQYHGVALQVEFERQTLKPGFSLDML